MQLRQSTYHSPTFEAFKVIEQDDWHNIVRFYEEHRSAILQLEFLEFFELLLSYANALFEIGQYQKYLAKAQTILRLSIEENIQYFQEEDIYQKTLFQKSAAHYQLLQMDKAEHTLRELCKINPQEAIHEQFLLRCLRQKKPTYLHATRAGCILFYLSSAFLIFIKILLIDPFWGNLSVFFEWAWISLLILGCSVLAFGELRHEWQIRIKVKQFLAKAKLKSAKH